MNKPWAEVAGERRLAERTEKAAAQLRERRLARKLTQAAIAKELGVTANAVARWERCERPIPHWVTPYLSMQEKIAELTSALAEGKKTQKDLRETIELKNFELLGEKATLRSLRKGHSADQLLKKLFDAFRADQHTLRKIYMIHESLVRPPKTINGELCHGDSGLRPADGA
jgi:transcriptional regulator with XRE-family HTH domain